MTQQSLFGTPKKLENTHKDMCTPMFIVALVTITKTQKQPKCPLTGDWIKTMWVHTSIYSGTLLSHKKLNETAICDNMVGS